MDDKIYIVIIEDKHSDILVYPYSNPYKAIDCARAFVKLMSKKSGVYEEHDYGIDNGWIYFGQYTDEGDNAHVVTSKMNGDIDA